MLPSWNYEPERANATGTYPECLAQMVGYKLLAINDFGLEEHDLDKCRNLFEVLESRDPSKSTMVNRSMTCSVSIPMHMPA